MKLGNYVKILSGYAFDSKEFNENGVGMPIIRIRDVGKDKISTYYSGVFNEDFIIQKGDLLIGMDGDFRLAKWLCEDALLNQRVCKIQVNSNELYSDYLFYYLPKELKKIEDSTSFATVKHLSVKKIQDIQIPLPPLDQQKKLASILDAADAYRQKTKALISKYDELTQSLFLDMFGDPVKNEKGWEVKSFEEMVRFDTRMTNDFEKYGNLLHVGIGNIEKNTGKIIDCVTANEEGLTSGKYLFDDRHIIYSKIRPNLNKVALPDFTGLCSADSYPLLPIENISNRVFIAFILRSECFLDFILQHSTRTNIPKANKVQMKLFKGYCPPFNLQTQFAERVQAIEQQKAKAQESLEKAEELFNSLLQKAFNGELVEP